jgi:peptidoglycan/LPS O-acetylase OafA/YrhL
MSASPHLAYRPEIDGLRAIAVLSVVLYHFGVPGLGGGFIGVDVFFVISGFLIGGLLWREQSTTGSISLKRFYIRRIKRLAPAYVAMAIATLIAAYFILLPFEFRAFGKSLIAATVYLSNVNFFREAGYFDSASDDKALLHTWSLSVEEQFYIVLPLLMLLLIRRPTSLYVTLWTLFLASLIACLWMTPKSQPAAFYLFPFRAWELLAGVLLAIEAQRRQFSFAVAAFFSYTGLALLIGSILMIPAGTTFPGLLAAAPVFATVLLIANGQHDNRINRALQMRLPVALGLISYSLYLWHWPVLTLSSYYRGGYSGPFEIAGWIALCMILAVLSWRFIEQPVRHAKNLGALPTFGSAILASAALIAAGGFIFVKDGMLNRFPAELRTHINASADFLQDWSRCTVPADGPFAGLETCPIGPEGSPQTLIWGDSHVRALKEGLEQAALENETPALLIWRAGCAPIFGLTKSESAATPLQNAQCTEANTQIETGIAASDFAQILLVGRWGYYALGGGTGRDSANTITARVTGTSGTQAEQIGQGLAKTARSIKAKGAEVFILNAIPEIPNYDSREIARALAGNRLSPADLEHSLTASLSDVTARAAPLDRAVQDLASDGITILDPAPYFCEAAECSAIQDGAAQYFDNNHIVNEAARRIRSLFDPIWGTAS